MEALSSSNIAYLVTESVVDNNQGYDSVGGRKSGENVADLVEISSDEVSSDELSLEDVEDYDSEEDSDEDSEEDSDDEEEEEEDNERKNIFKDLYNLKKLAEFFQHPEKPVDVDGFAAGRSYFSRSDAADYLDEHEDEACADALADALALKKSAAAYLHPERPLEVDATACARNYFSQPWASEQETFGQAELRAHVVKESHLLKERAAAYRHPEAPIDMEPGMNMARNYFLRASAPEQEDGHYTQMLEDTKALKALASDYLHPEKPLEIDAAACARGYFSRPSAPEQEEDEYCDDRDIILEEMKELKQLASDFLHPEKLVEMDSIGARSYFDRSSAATEEDAAEKELILQEMQTLKKLAACYMHPEKPLDVDTAACARNYFSRSSAPEQEEDEHCDDREIVLEEMKELRQLASDFLHPEKPLEIDATACARSYFSRPSAPDQEDDDYCDEREIILEEMKELKQAAVDFMHPEKPFRIDSIGARSYYDRPSAPEEYNGERELILQEMQALKKLASDFMHPEKPLEVDATVYGRNYFSRISALEQEEGDCSVERAMILKDAAALKQKAVDYFHPEKPVEMDPAASGRNYFSRPSAPEYEDDEYASNHERIHMDAAKLYHYAMDYLHPERPVTVDPTAFGRNYYSRASADDQELQVEEGALALRDAEKLKKLASDYMHPEKPLDVHPTSYGRNYYGRASAAESVDEIERALALSDASVLKRLAMDYRHPEEPVKTSDPGATGRNYFARPSAAGVAEHITSSGFANPKADEYSHHDDYGHFEMDEEIFYDFRQSIVVPLAGEAANMAYPKIQSSKISAEEEGELSRSPSSVMLFTGALEAHDHPPLPSMG